MSRIHRALERMKKGAGNASSGITARRSDDLPSMPQSVLRMAHRKAIEITGERHKVDEVQLVRRGLLAPLDQALPVADEFRRIKRPLIDNFVKNPGQSRDHMNLIMVASALPGAGKTFCSVNLAVSMSLERELSVLLVDADVAKPHISDAFYLGARPGLIDILEDDTLSLDSVLVRTDLNDLQILPAGLRHAHATELLASSRMAAVMHELASRYSDRIIVMDSPPLLRTSEAQALARQAGQIALVVESGSTTERQMHAAMELLDPDRAINIIFNKTLYSDVGGYYGGNYGYYRSRE